MVNYVIPFWTVFSIIFLVLGVLIWLSVLKSRDNKRIQMGQTAILYLLEECLSRMLQKTVHLMLQFEKFSAKKGMDVRFPMIQQKWWKENVAPIGRELSSFARGPEVIQQILEQMRLSTFEKIDIFLFPDVLISRANPKFYWDLLTYSSKIVLNESTLFEKYTNDESKEYLSALLQTIKKNELKTKEIDLQKIVYTS